MIDNLFYYGDVGLIYGGHFASKDMYGWHILSIRHDNEDAPELNVSRCFVWADDISNELLAGWNGMSLEEYIELPEFIRAIDESRYASREKDEWTITLPCEDEPYFFEDDNETILSAIAGDGIGMNEMKVSQEWRCAIER